MVESLHFENDGFYSKGIYSSTLPRTIQIGTSHFESIITLWLCMYYLHGHGHLIIYAPHAIIFKIVLLVDNGIGRYQCRV